MAPAWRRALLGLVSLTMLGMHNGAVAAQPDSNRGYQLRAAFLYNLCKFVEWPPDSFADAASPLVIGVLGATPVKEALTNTVENRQINGRSIVVIQVHDLETAKASHLLFVTPSEQASFTAMRNELRDQAVLTVGEATNFLATGGSIRFVPVGDKLSFTLNDHATARARLKVSSQLQKLSSPIAGMP